MYSYNSLFVFIFFLMIRRPPRSTRTDTLFPDTTLFRSAVAFADMGGKLNAPLKASGKQGDYTVYPVTDTVGEYVLTDFIRSKPVYFDLGNTLEPAYYVELSAGERGGRSEEHTSKLQSLMRISYAVFCLKKKNKTKSQKEQTTNKY